MNDRDSYWCAVHRENTHSECSCFIGAGSQDLKVLRRLTTPPQAAGARLLCAQTACPAAKIFFAAFTSEFSAWPQAGGRQHVGLLDLDRAKPLGAVLAQRYVAQLASDLLALAQPHPAQLAQLGPAVSHLAMSTKPANFSPRA